MGDNTTNDVPITESATQSDNAILLYNSQNIAPEQLQAQFSIRLKEYGRVWQDIKKSKMTHPEQHYLIQGVRGAGKTMFLTKLAQDVGLDESLKDWLIPILLNEEEYSIFSLFTFWLRVAQILSSSHTEFSELYEQINTLDEVHDDLEGTQLAELAWQHIREALQKHDKKIIILMDNMAELFDSFSDTEHAQLREALSLHAEVRIIGGSSVILDSHFDTQAPFYQFFKMVNLKSISQDEMHTLLKTLAKQVGREAQEKINTLITEHPERIEAVRRLTDGVPRTITLLFQIIMEGAKSSSYAYLEETIDKTTPLYKHRMDDLSRQQKPIVHAIAMSWDAVSAKEIAEATRLPSKTVSAQISQLQKQWIIEKIPTNTKNHLYAIKERFFNIWYLMRYGNAKEKQRVLWLTRFLESWCDKRDLENRLLEVLENGATDGLNFDYVNALLSSTKLELYKRKEVLEKLKKVRPDKLVQIGDIDYKGKALSEIRKAINDSNFVLMDKIIREQKFTLNFEDALMVGIVFLPEMKELGLEILLNAESLVKNIKELGLMLHFYINDGISVKKQFALDNVNALSNYINSVEILKILLWNNKFDEFLSKFKTILNEYKAVLDKSVEELTNIENSFLVDEEVYLLLLAKKQTEIAYNVFQEYNLKEQLKPIYYAIVSLLPDERNQEYLRMGSELKPTVDEILQKVEEYRVKYA